MTLARVRGAEDLTGQTYKKHQHIIQVFKNTADLFCFKNISTPILEKTSLFSRSLGLDSDIINKEMFTLEEAGGGDSLSLRPEGTAPVARHFLTEKLKHQLPLRWMYQGPMFRYERPQKGRLRQFHTVGVEILGEESGRADIECLSLAWLFLKNLKLEKEVILEINSLGDTASRTAYKKVLIEYLNPLKKKLSEESQTRLAKNPLRILDSKQEEDQSIIKKAPVLSDFLNNKSKEDFSEILKKLESLQIPYKTQPRLVRGLDYYSRSVYEFKSPNPVMGAQNTVLAGGRYDSLISLLSDNKESVPGTGFGAGVERLSLLMQESPIPSEKQPIALAPLGEEAEKQAVKLAWKMRQAGIKVFHPRPTGSLSKKMKRASQMKAGYAVIFGPEEIKNKKYSVKNMQDESQQSLNEEELISFLNTTQQNKT